MKKETGLVIKAIRLRLGYKQDYVAQKINISPSLLGHIENGRTDLDIRRLYQLAKVFGVLPRNLLELVIEIYESECAAGLDGAVKYINPPATREQESKSTKAKH
ncbi:helix-turn-helix transcriptional regulator [Pedobacter sp. SL55]|uniref:helix-turn-helix transcriptional regulator n=1 Tax=Pedobacter sp. SL55 TaxID=2995161 RepID=UPI00226DBD3A|nr:helix-turn-helix transcriptional regulator [Pedobacter sp. SL55]WAC41530.1 helix-turn-helix transcriptional regulator [Pedobacter sp. SL55]